MITLEYSTILSIVEDFYDKANNDILIGYHFRVIEDFSSHLPRIASFWQLQLTGYLEAKQELPFNLIEVHRVLKINKGEVFRWQMLFQQTLDQFEEQKKISSTQKRLWMEKIELFKARILLLVE